MPPLKIGLIGCGQIAQAIHLQVLSAWPGVELAALAEVDAARRAQAKQRAPQAAAFSDYRDLLAAQTTQAVVICLPTALHAEAAEAAFQAGQHVYLEKPLAVTEDEGARVLAAWRRAGRAGMIGFNYRFHPLAGRLRRELLAGRIGPPAGAQTVFATAGGLHDGWRGSRAEGGGALLDLASHHIDLARWLFEAEVGEVFARLHSRHSEQDTAALELQLTTGPMVQVFVAFGTVEEDRIEVFGPQGKLRLDRYRALDVEYSAPSARFGRWRRMAAAAGLPGRLPYWRQKRSAPGNEPSYALALAHFCEAVRAGQPPTPSLLDGFRSLAVVAAAEQAARTGRPRCPVEPPD